MLQNLKFPMRNLQLILKLFKQIDVFRVGFTPDLRGTEFVFYPIHTVMELFKPNRNMEFQVFKRKETTSLKTTIRITLSEYMG